MRTKPTPHDEYKYDEALRAEDSVKTEVIVHLTLEVKQLRKDMCGVMSSLIDAQRSLDVYRTSTLNYYTAAHERPGDCATGCRDHVWDTKDGWKMAKKPSPQS